MRIVMGHVDEFSPSTARFAKQLGLDGIQFHNPRHLADSYPWSVKDLEDLRNRCAEAGLVIEGMENVPPEHFQDVIVGGPRRDEQISRYLETIRNLGRTGIPLLGYHFMANYVWRTDMATVGRGGARVTAFDLADADKGNKLLGYPTHPGALEVSLTEEDLWRHHGYFLGAVLPAAEQAGVRLALHPDDPPVAAPLGGVPRVFTNVEALVRAARQAKSRAWGVNLCIGTLSELGGQAVVEQAISALGATNDIAYVHLRDVVGTVPAFREGFLGEGNLDVPAVLHQLQSVGFDSFIIDDHVPAMVGDNDTWGDTSPAAYESRGRAHAVGYLQGALQCVTRPPYPPEGH